MICAQISDFIVKEIEKGATDWRCTNCRRSSSRRSIINSGVERSDSVSSIIEAGDRTDGNLDQTFSELAAEVKLCLQSFKTIDKKFEELQAIAASVKQHDKRILALEQDNKTIKSDNKAMKSAIKNLTMQLENNEQRHSANKLIINGAPYKTDENVLQTVKFTLQKLDIIIEDAEIQDARRMFGEKRKFNPIAGPSGTATANDSVYTEDQAASLGSEKGSMVSNNNPIVVSLATNKKRNSILKLFKEKRGVLTNEKSKIYIHEYLIPNRRRLLQKTKLFAKTNGFKYVWTKNGTIFIKKADDQKTIAVNVFTDFAVLGGLAAGSAQDE